ncbi:MAG: DUF4442 domain-containing protein [Pseudomonadota bacterium]
MADQTTEMYELMKAFFEENVPYAKLTGIELLVIADGHGAAQLPDRPETKNHIGTQHAGALFTLAEAASGAACVSLFADKIAVVRASITEATISYVRSARGAIRAEGRLRRDGKEILSEFSNLGLVTYGVDVSLTDAEGREVASMDVTWRIKSTITTAHAA